MLLDLGDVFRSNSMRSVLYVAAVIISLALAAPVASYAQTSLTPPPDVQVEATGVLTQVDVGSATPVGSWTPKIINSAPEFFPLGKTTITWFAWDGADRAVATQTVTVQDTTPPEFSDVPAYAKFTTNSTRGTVVDFGLPPAVDLVDIDVDVTSSHRPGYKFPVGNTTVTFTATDDSGNSATRDTVIIVTDIHPRVQNLSAESTHDTIRVSWDRLEGHSTYKVVLTEVDTGEKAGTLKRSGISNIFTDLKPETDYMVLVFALGDRSTKASVEISTKLAPFRILDDFSDISQWTYHKINRTFEIPTAYNNYEFTVDNSAGRPAPSGKISGYGYGAYAQIERVFDLTDFRGDQLFVGFDYRLRADSSSSSEANLYFLIKGSDAKHREVLLNGGTYDTGWQSYSRDITDIVGDDTSVKIAVFTHDYLRQDWNREVFYDNLYIGSLPPPPT